MGFLGSIGTAIKSGANTAVGLAPYASRLLAQRQAQDEADQQTKLKNLYAKNADDRATAMLKLAQDRAAADAEGEWEKAEPMTVGDETIMAQRNKRTGVYRRAELGDAGPKSAPGMPINAPKSVIPDAAIGRGPSTPSISAPAAPSAQMPGDSQDMGGDSPTSQAASVEQAGQAPQTPAAPKPRTLRPFVKPAPPVAQQHVVDPVTGEVKFFDPTKPPPGLRVNPAPKAPKSDAFTFPTMTDPTTGKQVVVRANTHTGEITPTDFGGKGTGAGNLPAPMASKVGQAGEMIKKASDLLPMMEKLGVSLGQSASADVAQNGVGIGHMRIPGTKGVGNLMLNSDATYAQYQAALTPFVLAAAHALSGARINQDQVNQIRQSIEIAPGDLKNPTVMKQKTKNLLDLVNSISGSLPGDAMGAQEDQIDAKALAALEGYGYKRAVRKSVSAPTSAAGTAAPKPTAKPAGKPGADYGIFGKPNGDEE